MASQYCIVTTLGQEAINTAVATGVPVVLTNFKIGNAVSPVLNPSDTDIQSPVYTGNFTGKIINPINNYISLVECVIPYTSGGYDITQIGLYYTNSNGDLVLFAESTYPNAYKQIGVTYTVDLVVETGGGNGNPFSVTVPSDTYATQYYVDVTKKATVADITNPLTNDGVYITPLWLQEYQSDGRGFINASFTTSSATFQDDLAAAIAPCIIKATSNIIGTVDGIEYSLVPGDILYKTLNISGSAEYSIILQSYTQFLNALSSPFSIPLSICSPGKIITVYNSTTNNITVNLDSSLSVITGGQSFNLPGNSTITLTRVINTNTMVITGLLGPVLTNLL